MRFKTIIFLFLVIISGFLYYCSPALYTPVRADAENAKTSLDTLMMGRKLYIDNCASCHTLYVPERFTSKKWETELNEMQKKAKINEAQKALIFKYLTSKSLH